ncbi:hypothetical protein FOA52_010753 [Chlamydomonas sp. UWO 241]|nr:hypothetical protein FOA52_010753 [Chlamydomonas sp. UWO 241]
MAYNLYQAQMARGWQKRIEKENAAADRFWADHAAKARGEDPSAPPAYIGTGHMPSVMAASQPSPTSKTSPASTRSRAPPSEAPTGYTSKTSYMSDRLSMLEAELQLERAERARMEEQLTMLKTTRSSPGTPCPATPPLSSGSRSSGI